MRLYLQLHDIHRHKHTQRYLDQLMSRHAEIAFCDVPEVREASSLAHKEGIGNPAYGVEHPEYLWKYEYKKSLCSLQYYYWIICKKTSKQVFSYCKSRLIFVIVVMMAREFRELSPTPPGTPQQVDAPPGALLQPSTLSNPILSAPRLTQRTTHNYYIPSQIIIAKEKAVEKIHNFVFGNSHFAVLAGETGMQIGLEVGKRLGTTIPSNPEPFANRESRVVVGTDIAATKDIYIVQSVTFNDPHTPLRELKNLELGAKSAHANRITAIFTQLPYGRQDKIEQPGAPDAARNVIQEILDAGSHNYRKKKHQSKLTADASLLVVEVHSEDPFRVVERDSHLQWANLNSAYVLAPRIEEIIKENNLDVVIGFPDHGAKGRFGDYIQRFTPGKEPAVIDKVRDIHQNNKTKIVGVSGEVAGKDVILVDDIIDTGGSILDAARKFKEMGAKSVRLVATHGIFSNSALEKMNDEAIDGIIITDTINPRAEVLSHPKIEIVSIAPLLAETIKRIEERKPLGELAKAKSKNFDESYQTWKANKERRIAKRAERRARRHAN